MQLEPVRMDGEEWQHVRIDYRWEGEADTHQYDIYWTDKRGRLYKDGELICVDVRPDQPPAAALCN